jgi:hypothetical protein
LLEFPGGKVKVLKQPRIVHIVLDVLKPHQPSLPDFATSVKELGDIEKVDVTVVEIDRRTMSLRVTVDGNVNYEILRDHMAKEKAVIKSVDHIVVE